MACTQKKGATAPLVLQVGSQKPSRVCEQIDLAAFALHSEIMTELALEALGTLPSPKVLANNGLGVNACIMQPGCRPHAIVAVLESTNSRHTMKVGCSQ